MLSFSIIAVDKCHLKSQWIYKSSFKARKYSRYLPGRCRKCWRKYRFPVRRDKQCKNDVVKYDQDSLFGNWLNVWNAESKHKCVVAPWDARSNEKHRQPFNSVSHPKAGSSYPVLLILLWLLRLVATRWAMVGKALFQMFSWQWHLGNPNYSHTNKCRLMAVLNENEVFLPLDRPSFTSVWPTTNYYYRNLSQHHIHSDIKLLEN